MKPKFDHKVKRPFTWVPAAATDVSKTIKRERDRIEKQRRAQAHVVEPLRRPESVGPRLARRAQ